MAAKKSTLVALALMGAACCLLSGCADLRWRGVSNNLLTDMGYQKAKNDCMVYKDQTQYRECVARVEREFGEVKGRQN